MLFIKTHGQFFRPICQYLDRETHAKLKKANKAALLLGVDEYTWLTSEYKDTGQRNLLLLN